MIIFEWIQKRILSIKEWFIFYIRAFYDPRLYRDVAFREKGYGLKRVYVLLMFLMLPSFIVFNLKINHLFENQWKEDISSLPYLSVNSSGLLNANAQMDLIKNKIDQDKFLWVPGEQLPVSLLKMNYSPEFIINDKFLWGKIPVIHFMGFQWFQVSIYFPMVQWSMVKEPVMGASIYQAIKSESFGLLTFMLCSVIAFVNIFYVTFFIRVFAFVGRVMARLLMNDNLDYSLTCRLLSLSAIPTLCFATIYFDLVSQISEASKYIILGVYMFYFYLSIRFIRAKSSFTWLEGFR